MWWKSLALRLQLSSRSPATPLRIVRGPIASVSFARDENATPTDALMLPPCLPIWKWRSPPSATAPTAYLWHILETAMQDLPQTLPFLH